MWSDLYKIRNESEDIIWPLSKYCDDVCQLGWVASLSVERSSTLRKQEGWGFYYRKEAGVMGGIRDDFVVLTANDHDDPIMDKIVSIKEIMHVYDNDFDRFANTPEKVGKLIEHFYGKPMGNGGDDTEAFIKSEPIAYWRCVSVITTENYRQKIKAMVAKAENADEQKRTIAFYAWELRTPSFIIEALISDSYDAKLRKLGINI